MSVPPESTWQAALLRPRSPTYLTSTRASLRPCRRTSSAPRRRAPPRQTLLADANREVGGESRKPMRPDPSARPSASSIAVPTLWEGTKPSWRAARRVAAAADDHRAEPCRSALRSPPSPQTAAADGTCRPPRYRRDRPRHRSRPLPPRPSISSGSSPARVAWKNARYGCCVGMGEAAVEPVERG